MNALFGRALTISTLCLYPAAAPLLAQTTASPACLKAMATIRSRCCGNAFALPFSQPVTANSKQERLWDCSTHSYTDVECIPRGAISKDTAGKTIEKEGPDAKASSSACQQALEGLAACGPAKPGEPRQLCEDDQLGSRLTLPICEDIHELSETLESSDCKRLDVSEVIDGLDDALGGLGDLASKPDEVKLLKAPPEQLGAGTPSPLTPKQLPVPNWNAPSPVLRLEIPGNFLRFFLANAALPSALQGFEQKAKAANLGGIVCDPAALTCTIEQLSVIPNLDQVIQKGLKPPFKMDVVRDGSGWKFSNLGYETGDVKVIFHGDVFLKPKEPIRIDLRHGTHLQIVPLHDPKATNGYATSLVGIDRQASFLDRGQIITGLKGAECKQLVDKNQGYVTFIQPYRCSCGAADSQTSSVLNFCVADPWPRPAIPELAPAAMQAKGWFVRQAYCNEQPSAANASGILVDNSDMVAAQIPPASHVSAETPLAVFYKQLGMSDAGIAELAKTFDEVGCSGRRMKRLALGPQIPLNTGQLSFAFGERVTSAAGFKLSTQVDFGALDVSVGTTDATAWIEVQLPVFAKAEEWVRKKFGSVIHFIVKWIIRLIRHILEAVLTMLATVTLKEVNNHGTIDFGSLDFEVHGLLSHASGDDGSSQLEIGVRRVVSSTPDIHVKNLDLVWLAPHCKDLLSNHGDGIGAKLKDKLKNALGCALEVPSATIEQATYPIKRFLAEDLFGLLTLVENRISDKLTSVAIDKATKLEAKNDLAGLIGSASRTVLLRPYYLVNSASAARAAMAIAPGQDLDEQATQILRRLPPPFNQVCLASSQPAFSCLVANLFAGHQLRVPGATLLRVGAMTHYRSLWEGDQKSVFTDWNYPTVRYCVGGDTPPGLKEYAFFGTPPALLQHLTDFDEMDRTPSPADRATDWRTQCAAFVDLGVKVHTTTPEVPNVPTRDVIVVPSVRTNFLLNEVFFCPDNASCDPATPTTEKRRSIRYRALLASCSMLADFWYASCPEDANGLHCDQVQTYVNAAIDADSTRQVLMGLLAQSCGDDPSCQAQASAAANAADPVKACLGMLAEQGFSVPLTLKAADIPAGLK